ncbi:hypothetical protein E2562_029269 [Oryza meyeriana var. granulata]|uniref:Uncharacterized protein n=1 Tax=Oryza meyeriana var. granulata TaxID=110450 RepID=A0A6G1BML0_9ORYZ|nr:hypothetical protein E2562_029269 [Oryza meyeriana var. granulata]
MAETHEKDILPPAVPVLRIGRPDFGSWPVALPDRRRSRTAKPSIAVSTQPWIQAHLLSRSLQFSTREPSADGRGWLFIANV